MLMAEVELITRMVRMPSHCMKSTTPLHCAKSPPAQVKFRSTGLAIIRSDVTTMVCRVCASTIQFGELCSAEGEFS